MSMSGENRKTTQLRHQSTSAPVLAVVAMLGLTSMVACEQAAGVKAMMTFKQANQAYAVADYKRSVALYEETIQNNPDLAQVYFFLGNSYDNLYNPMNKGDAANEEILAKAVKNYTIASEKLTTATPEDTKLKTLTLQYLAATYGPDKLNDPVKAEPVIQAMIQLDPAEPGNYFQLSKLYEDAGAYDEAEKMLLKAKEVKPAESGVYMQLASYYNRQGQFDKTIVALEQRAEKEPTNPEAFHTIASFYWDESSKNVRLKDAEKKDYVLKGLVAENRALELKPDYVEAMVFKGLLLRLEANLEKDPGKQQALLKEATQLSSQAEETRKKKASGV